MKFKFIKSLLLGTAALLAASCANDDNYGNPLQDCVESGIEANIPVATLAARATATPTLYPVSAAGVQDDYIEGYVTSSDERGSFFKVVTLQTKPTDGSAPRGFSIAIDANGLFGKGFTPGRKVLVKLNGLYYGIEYNALKLGAIFENTSVGRIAEGDFAKNVIIGCTKVSEDSLVQRMTITEALRDANINKLIELDSVQFNTASFGYSLYDASAPTANGSNPQTIGGSTNHNLEDKYGHTIIFRTSSFANFAGDAVKTGTLRVRGVLTKYRDAYQFLPRYSDDIKEISTTRLVPEDEPVNPGTGPGANAVLLFQGSDFENAAVFAAGINGEFGIKPYATVSPGNGQNGSGSLNINTTGATANDYVFNSHAAAGLPATYSKVTFYVKGTSSKSLSINLYTANRSVYYKFNLGDVTTDKTVTQFATNQYTGAINTNNQWVLITLDLAGITDLNLSPTADIFALKVGSAAPYDLNIDNFKIE